MGLSASQARLLKLTARMSDVEFSAQQLANGKMRLAAQSEEVSKAYTESLDKKKLIFQTGMRNSTAIYVDMNANVLTGYNAESTQAQRILTNSGGQVLVSSSVNASYYSSLWSNTNVATGVTNVPAAFDTFLESFGLAKDKATADLHNASAPATLITYDADKVAYYKNIFDAAQVGGGTFAPEVDADMNDQSWLYNQLSNGALTIQKWNSNANTGAGGFDSIAWQSGDGSIQEVADTEGESVAKAKYDTDMVSINNKDKRFDLDLKALDTEHSAIQTEYDSVKKVLDKNIERSYKTFSG